MPDYTPPSSGGGGGTVTLPIAESDVTSLVADLAAKGAATTVAAHTTSIAAQTISIARLGQSDLVKKMEANTALSAPTITNAGTTNIATGTTITSALTINLTTTNGSSTVTQVSGTVPTVGAGVLGTGLANGSFVGSVNGSTLTITDWAGVALPATSSVTNSAFRIVNQYVPWVYDHSGDMFPNFVYGAVVCGLRAYSTASSVNRRIPNGAEPLRITFDFDGQAFEFLMDQAFAALPGFRVWANEQVSGMSAAVTQTNAAGFTKVDFGSRAYRRVIIETDGSADYFGGLRRANTDTIKPPSLYSPTKFAVVGDSFGEGAGVETSTRSTRGYADILAHLLGFTKLNNLSISGTGLTNAGSDGTYRTRITDLTGPYYTPDVLLIQGSTNDSAAGTAAVQTELTTYLGALVAALPNTKIVVLGVVGVQAASAGNLNTNAGMKAACAAMSPAISFIDPQTGPEGAWMTGTGRVGATAGDGNADFYNSSVTNFHPSVAGHDYMARQVAAKMAPLIGVGL